MADFLTMSPWLLVFLLAAGAGAGFLGGLFGIGGGIVIVPTLYAVFQAMGVGEAESLKTAIGTSLSVIIVTSVRALMTHRRAGHVDIDFLRAWTPWVALGAGAGGVLARWAPAGLLTAIFCAGAIFVAWRRLRPKPVRGAVRRDLSRRGLKIPFGFGAGFFSALMGLGGGAVGVMVMTSAGRSMHQAVGTAAGFGMAVAAPGVAGFILSGYGAAGLPPGAVGYVNAPAFIALALMAAVTAPLGAHAAHRASGVFLSKMFGVFIAFVAIGLFWDVFFR